MLDRMTYRLDIRAATSGATEGRLAWASASDLTERRVDRLARTRQLHPAFRSAAMARCYEWVYSPFENALEHGSEQPYMLAVRPPVEVEVLLPELLENAVVECRSHMERDEESWGDSNKVWWEPPTGGKKFDYHAFLYDEEYPEWSGDSADSRHTISNTPQSSAEVSEAQLDDHTDDDHGIAPSYPCRPFTYAEREAEKVDDRAHALASIVVLCELCQHIQSRLQQQLEKAIVFGTRISVARREIEAAKLVSASCDQCRFVRERSEQQQRRGYLEVAAGGHDVPISSYTVGNTRGYVSDLTTSARREKWYRFPTRPAPVKKSRNVPAWLRPKAPKAAVDTSSDPSSNKLDFEQRLSSVGTVGDRPRRYQQQQQQHRLGHIVSKANSASSSPNHHIITGLNKARLIASPTQPRLRMQMRRGAVVRNPNPDQVVATSARLKSASIEAVPIEPEASIPDSRRRSQASKKCFRSCLPGSTSNASVRQRTKPGVRNKIRDQQNQDQGQIGDSTESSTDYRDSDPVAQHSRCRSRTDVVKEVGRWLAGLTDGSEEDFEARSEWDGLIRDAADS